MAYKKSKNVNLDALIQREDFEASDESMSAASKIATLSINDLREGSGLFLASVRKPDFQRETADWDIDKVARFIKSFVDGEFIPAVILWRSQAGLIFVIDGSHRLSSLIAWVNDDYGDGQFSLDVFDGAVPDEQRELAKKAREKINAEIGPYNDYYKALRAKHPDNEIIVKARNLASRALPIQWIEGDVATAEKSFFNINQQATPIDPTELELLQKRKSPNCIAARSIMRAGKGHKYWHNFEQEAQDKIEKLADSINKLLFEPLVKRPIKSLDLPICDKNNNTLTLVYDFVSFANSDDKNKDKEDLDGQATIRCLRNTEKLVQLFSSTVPGSYGLHPIIYCYSNKGNFRPASFYGAMEFVKDLSLEQSLRTKFIKNRKEFENFLFENDSVVQRIIDTYRRGTQSAKHIAEYYIFVLERLDAGKDAKQIQKELLVTPKYHKLKLGFSDESDVAAADFNTGNKSEVFIRQSLQGAPRCAICGGYLHLHSISIDHIQRKREGGTGSADNGQLTHPYCNTGVKN